LDKQPENLSTAVFGNLAKISTINDLCIIITEAAPRPPDWGAGELWRVYKALVRRTAKYTATIL
jgi:hypothetical protein